MALWVTLIAYQMALIMQKPHVNSLKAVEEGVLAKTFKNRISVIENENIPFHVVNMKLEMVVI